MKTITLTDEQAAALLSLLERFENELMVAPDEMEVIEAIVAQV